MGGRGRHIGVTYSRHARQQVATRLVADAQVERTIANPTRQYSSTDPPGRVVAERLTAAGNTLRVVYAEVATATGVVAHVVTVIRIGGRRR